MLAKVWALLKLRVTVGQSFLLLNIHRSNRQERRMNGLRIWRHYVREPSRWSKAVFPQTRNTPPRSRMQRCVAPVL